MRIFKDLSYKDSVREYPYLIFFENLSCTIREKNKFIKFGNILVQHPKNITIKNVLKNEKIPKIVCLMKVNFSINF